MKVEDQYTDVLQNIECVIVAAYRQRPDMSDYAVMRMLEALIDRYVAEKIGREPRDFRLSDEEVALVENVRHVCEWRLGRSRLSDDADAEEPDPEANTVDEILLCLKRLVKSVKKWNKHGGSQGYLNFIVRYVK